MFSDYIVIYFSKLILAAEATRIGCSYFYAAYKIILVQHYSYNKCIFLEKKKQILHKTKVK
jgi:hypothetical protein